MHIFQSIYMSGINQIKTDLIKTNRDKEHQNILTAVHDQC